MLKTNEELIAELEAENREWAEAMRLDSDCDCYVCGEEIVAGTTSYPLQANGYGFCWGSDGYFPDNASAMYACWNCRNHWIDAPKEEGDDDDEDSHDS